MKAARINAKHNMEIIELPKPLIKPDEVLIKVEASGICGTDLHMYEGDSMGSYPVIPGHEFAGTVVEAGSLVSRLKVGDRAAVEPNLSCGNCPACLENRQHLCHNWQALGVTLAGGMSQYVAAPECAVFNIGELDFESGSFVEPLSCVLHGVERLGAKIGDRILLLGSGPIGVLMARVLKISGAAQIDILEVNEGRRQLAAREKCGDLFGSLGEIAKDYYDAVIDATGVPAVQQEALMFVRFGGKILFFGVAPQNKTIEIEPYIVFRKELLILSSFTSLRNSMQVVRLLESGQVTVSDLISHRFPLEQIEEAFKLILNKSEPVLKVLIKPWC